jgi:hypothetical protein
MQLRFSERTKKLALRDGKTAVLYWHDVVFGYGYLVRSADHDTPPFYSRNRIAAVNAIMERVRMHGGIA